MGLGDVVGGLVGGGSEDDDGSPADGDGELGGEFGADEDFDDLGGWEDEDDELDDLGGGDDGGGGGAAADLEPRLDELEAEMERISSTMGTVRSENESITETVDDIEDNVRKLLEIYEMVTRGVNPFVDEADEGDTMGDGFSLFDGGGGGGGGAEPGVEDADADSFFDDDWDEGSQIDDDFEDEVDDEAVEAEATEPEPAAEEDDGKTFDDLKSEYEEGDPDWEDDAGLPDADDGDDATETADDGWELTEADDQPDEPESEPAQVDRSIEDGKPYLTELPGGYGADLLVMEWLSFLRSASSTPETLRAIRYYETIDWIGPQAAESLAQYLTGLGAGDPRSAADGSTQLSIDHHTRSLGYIGKLGGTEIQTARLQWTNATGGQVRKEGGTHRGIQR